MYEIFSVDFGHHYSAALYAHPYAQAGCCADTDCGPLADHDWECHSCLPGPPDDMAELILQRVDATLEGQGLPPPAPAEDQKRKLKRNHKRPAKKASKGL